MKGGNLFFSLSDLNKVVIKGKLYIAIAFVLCSILGFFFQISRPVHYTTQGIFKGHISGGGNRFFKALEFLGGEESYVQTEDPCTFLCSYPVLAGVVHSLNLQATITKKGEPGRLREMVYNLQTAYHYKRLKKLRPQSLILGTSICVPDRLIIPDKKIPLLCESLDFPGETSESLSIHFLSTTSYRVKRGSQILGTGSLGTPFFWEKGSFTLSGEGSEDMNLHFIPLTHAIKSLQNSLKIVRDKDNTSLFHVSYTHRDRQLASKIVNETMQQYQTYLIEEGKKKVNKQLNYLSIRQEETFGKLESMLSKQKNYLESQLEAGLILSLEQELDFMAQTQTQIRQRLLSIQSEMEILSKQSLPFPKLLEFLLKQSPSEEMVNLTVESVHDMIHFHQKELDGLLLDQERYDNCILKLAESSFDCSSLAKILNEPSLQPRFEKVHTLHHHLIDTHNWSLKERDQLQVELETERAFLKEYTRQLKEGAALHIQTIQKRIQVLHQNLLFLLANRYEQELNNLSSLALQAKHFPEKWFNEQKIDLTTKMSKDVMESITKLIEAKNIGYHLDSLLTQVLEPSIPSAIPDPPHLLLGTTLGGLLGILCSFMGLLFWNVQKGPTASFHNLIQQGKRVVPVVETIPLLGLKLTDAPIVLLAARNTIEYGKPLVDWLQKKGETVKVIQIDYKNPSPSLASSTFWQELTAYQLENERIILMATGLVSGFVIQALLQYARMVIYEVSDESLENLEGLPEDTIFVMQNAQKDDLHPKWPLQNLAPKLEHLFLKMKHSSFSAVKRVWRQPFPEP